MSSATETVAIVKPRNVNIELGKVYKINLPNGSYLLIEGNTVTLPGEMPTASKPEVKAEPNAQLEAPAPRRGGRKAAETPVENAAPVEAPAPVENAAPAADKPGLSKASGNRKGRWIEEKDFLGYAEYLTNGNGETAFREVVIIGKSKGRTPALLLAYPVWVKEREVDGETIPAHYAVPPATDGRDQGFWVSQKPEKNGGKLRNVNWY